MVSITIEKLPQFDGHEMVSYFSDQATGLRGFIAIHNTHLGPATGGTRYWRYDSEREALSDVLNLSRAMTYKCALAGVPYGGGKAVIMRNARYPKNTVLLSAYARAINLFNGKFYTGEDVGMTEHDVATLAKYSPFINGLPGKAGDPAPWAALSVFYAMEAGLKAIYGTTVIRGKTFAIKGLGKVGSEVVRLITERGGEVYGADIRRDAAKKAVRRFPKIKIVRSGDIHTLKTNVFLPCALGGDFNGRTIPQLKCDMVCGGANNQLVSPQDGVRLHERGILYIPDYVANAGGLINVAEEWNKEGYSRDEVRRKIKDVGKTAARVIALAQKKHQPTSIVADRMAEEIFTAPRQGYASSGQKILIPHQARLVREFVTA